MSPSSTEKLDVLSPAFLGEGGFLSKQQQQLHLVSIVSVSRVEEAYFLQVPSASPRRVWSLFMFGQNKQNKQLRG